MIQETFQDQPTPPTLLVPRHIVESSCSHVLQFWYDQRFGVLFVESLKCAHCTLDLHYIRLVWGGGPQHKVYHVNKVELCSSVSLCFVHALLQGWEEEHIVVDLEPLNDIAHIAIDNPKQGIK